MDDILNKVYDSSDTGDDTLLLDKICLMVAGCFYVTVIGGIIQTIIITMQEKQQSGTSIRRVLCILLLLPLLARALDMTLDYEEYYDRSPREQNSTLTLLHGLPNIMFLVPLCYVLTFWYVTLRTIVRGERSGNLGAKIFVPIVFVSLLLWCVVEVAVFYFENIGRSSASRVAHVTSLLYTLALSVAITAGFVPLCAKLSMDFRRATAIERMSGNWIYERDKRLVGKFGFLAGVFSVSAIVKSMVLVIIFYARPSAVVDMSVQTTSQVLFEFLPSIVAYFMLSEPLADVMKMKAASQSLIINESDDELYWILAVYLNCLIYFNWINYIRYWNLFEN